MVNTKINRAVRKLWSGYLMCASTQVCVRDNEAIQLGSIEVKEVDVGVQKPLRKTPRLF